MVLQNRVWYDLNLDHEGYQVSIDLYVWATVSQEIQRVDLYLDFNGL